MPIILQQQENLLTAEEVTILWKKTRATTHHVDDEITVRFVDEQESRRLNLEYRKKDKPTNVLTFSYGDATHDVALCLAVAEREATERAVTIRDYIALLLVHAFLHAAGMDHERSAKEAKTMHEAEQAILNHAGFNAILW